MKNYLLITIIFCLSVGCSDDSLTTNGVYFKISETLDSTNLLNVHYGIIDGKGNIVIPPQYKDLSTFDPSTGLAKAWSSKENAYGYINKDEKFVIPPKFDEAFNHAHNELARVKKGNYWGFIDKTGNYVVNPEFEKVAPFREGLAAVRFGNVYGFIDSLGKIVIDPKFEYWNIKDLFWGYEYEDDFTYLHSFQDERAVIRKNKKFGFIDKSGTVVIDPKYDFVTNFSNGIAKVAVCLNCDAQNIESFSDMILKWGIIDKNGQYILAPEYQQIGSFNQGVAPVATFEVKYENLSRLPFLSNNTIGEGRFYALGFIDEKGNWKIEPNFHFKENDNINKFSFSEGLAFVCQKDTCGYIDLNGKFIIPKKFFKTGFDSVCEVFSEGLAGVAVSPYTENYLYFKDPITQQPTLKRKDMSLIGFINKKGDFIINPRFKKATQFIAGVSMVQGYQNCITEMSCYIDTTGTYIWFDKNSKMPLKIIE